MEVGPIHVAYTPDDKQWLYTDLQPKTIPSRDGVPPPLTLRVANLGTLPHTFRLVAQPIERNLAPMQAAAVGLGNVDLAPGQLKEIPVHLPLSLLGRYTVEYWAATNNETVTQQEQVAVINAFDVAAGFRHWAAHRQWFNAPTRRPGTGTDGKVKMTVATVNNGLSLVPVFPVLPRQSRAPLLLPGSLTTAKLAAPPTPVDPGVFSVLTTQLSPAWLIQCAEETNDALWRYPPRRVGRPHPCRFCHCRRHASDGSGREPGYDRFKSHEPALAARLVGGQRRLEHLGRALSRGAATSSDDAEIRRTRRPGRIRGRGWLRRISTPLWLCQAAPKRRRGANSRRCFACPPNGRNSTLGPGTKPCHPMSRRVATGGRGP